MPTESSRPMLRRFRASLLTLGLLANLLAPAKAQFGDSVAGVGPINRSMGGASVAAPIDAAGALFWNPASIGGLGRSEMEFGVELLIPRSTVSSRINAGAFGPGVPSRTLAGNTGGNNGIFPLPAFGIVYQPEESPFTYGFGLFQIGGFGVNYPASRTNPALNPQAPFGSGVGPLWGSYQLIQLAPTVAYKLTDTLSVGVAANFDVGYLSANPGLFASPTRVNGAQGPGLNYPVATNGRSRYGGGFHLGLYYNPGNNWTFGASVKSPQWFDTYTFNGINAKGQAVTPKVDLDFPMVISVGTAYTGFDKLLLAADLRYFDFHNTDGFRSSGFDSTGAVRGLGWQNTFGMALGAQYLLSEKFTVRGGYTFSMCPPGDAVTQFNLVSPNLIQHSLAAGASYLVTEKFTLSLTYVHYFQNSIRGPLVSPATGPIAGTEVVNTSTGDSVVIGATVGF